MKRWLILLVLIWAAAAQAASLTGSFVGQVQGSEAFIALVAKGDKVLAYVCDGAKLAEWFRLLSNADGALEGKSAAGVGLKAQVETDTIKGSVILNDGKTLEFTATQATNEAGLYRSEAAFGETTYLGGWIVNQKSEQRGAVIGGGNLRAVVLPLSAGLIQSEASSNGKLCPGVASPKSRNVPLANVGDLLAWLVTPDCTDKAITRP
jgi:hypothetical protein